jgi:tetratricopeptide (TPR) repeat protein
MTDGFPDRLTQLRTRWKNDPSSRIFLQLAEEYRHLGRVQEAYEVLEAGLREHPGYLSALVAKGRCLLELGDAPGARGVLERVVQQDATQMVANKLLVRAYLETGEPDGARQRLDLYSLLNDSDPEIEELRRRVVAMSRPPRGPDGPHSAEPAERSRMDRTDTPEPPAASAADVFALGTAGSERRPAAEDDVFGLGPPQALPQAPDRPTAAVADEPREVLPPAVRARGEGTDGEPFPDLAPEHSHRLYHAALAAEGIFFLGGAAAAAASAAQPEAAPLDFEPAAAPMAPEPAATPRAVELAAAPMAPEPTTAPEAVELAAAPPVSAAPEPAEADTATLGQLYLRQGHFDEAERIFREVARREPDNAAAHQALESLESGRAVQRLDAEWLLAGGAGANDPALPPAARKAHLLQSYLTRLRQGRRPHVS